MGKQHTDLTHHVLQKWYPQKGEFAGGIIFRRYFGIGCGIPFTAEELEEVQAGINIGACSTLDVSAPAASDARVGTVSRRIVRARG